MTPCASPRTEVRSEILSLVVSEGSKDRSKSSKSSGSSTPSHNQLVSPGKNIVQYMMAGVDPTLRMHIFMEKVQKIWKNTCLYVKKYG
jgi:hypothetical protein